MNEWKEENNWLVREFKFKNYLQTIEFINKITDIAQLQDHHPNINFTYGYCKISLQTHDDKAITNKDYKLAKAIDQLCQA